MDIQQLLASLLAHNVKFLVIGAWALPAYGHTRMTQDVDIFIEKTEENARNTMNALQAVGYGGLEDADVQLFLTKKVLLRDYLLRTDIHPFAAGITFEQAWRNRVETVIKGQHVFVPSLDDFIAMKKAAGRDKDNMDLEVLYKIREIHEKNQQAEKK